MVFRDVRCPGDSEAAGFYFVGQPFLVILTADDRLPLLFLVTSKEVEELTAKELTEEIVERLDALGELLEPGRPVAILCNGSVKTLRALLCAKMSSRTHNCAPFWKHRDGRYRSFSGEDLDSVLEERYWIRI